MPSDLGSRGPSAQEHASVIDVGLLSPVTAGHDALVSDAAFLDALVTAEIGLSAAQSVVADGGQSGSQAPDAFAALGWRRGEIFRDHGISARELALDAVDGGNPVIPLVGLLRTRFAGSVGDGIHRGATSQDILDTALMLMATQVRQALAATAAAIEDALAATARERRNQVAAARTLTQHAVPTTVGLRVATWLNGVRRAQLRLGQLTLPAQLGGAGGTLAAFTLGPHGADAARLPALFALELGLEAPEAPWHTSRWPVTELGDALVQLIDAVAVIATDVATLSRTEIAEVSEGSPGGSSAMPQKRNPTRSVLIRSAGLRAPHLAASLHASAALAGDERPDGAWHAEWPVLRELMRLALGASANARTVVADLRFDDDAIARNLALTGAAILAERSSIDGQDASIDPAGYTGLAGELVDRAVEERP